MREGFREGVHVEDALGGVGGVRRGVKKAAAAADLGVRFPLGRSHEVLESGPHRNATSSSVSWIVAMISSYTASARGRTREVRVRVRVLRAEVREDGGVRPSIVAEPEEVVDALEQGVHRVRAAVLALDRAEQHHVRHALGLRGTARWSRGSGGGGGGARGGASGTRGRAIDRVPSRGSWERDRTRGGGEGRAYHGRDGRFAAAEAARALARLAPRRRASAAVSAKTFAIILARDRGRRVGACDDGPDAIRATVSSRDAEKIFHCSKHKVPRLRSSRGLPRQNARRGHDARHDASLERVRARARARGVASTRAGAGPTPGSRARADCAVLVRSSSPRTVAFSRRGSAPLSAARRDGAPTPSEDAPARREPPRPGRRRARRSQQRPRDDEQGALLLPSSSSSSSSSTTGTNASPGGTTTTTTTLRVASYIFGWYFLNAVFAIVNKRTLSAFPYP